MGANGRWYLVASLADLTEGATRPFRDGQIQGFLIHRNGQLQGRSRVGTHMGCALRVNLVEVFGA